MNRIIRIFFIVASIPAWAKVSGVQTYTTISPAGLTEECLIHRMPGVEYSSKDSEKENEFCATDLYSGSYAICAKTWSTSPGSVIYNIEETGLTVARAEDQCRQLNAKAIEGAGKIAKFKNTMNAKGTSGTYSQSSLVYYHFSRFFNTSVDVPVAVYRTIDKDEHLRRVSLRASEQGKMGRQMKAGWSKLIAAEKNPESYNPASELFTEDRRQIFGILIRGKGERYGVEINGVRSKWGLQQNIEFTETAPFLALRSEMPLSEAIDFGIGKARKNSKHSRALGGTVSHTQMVHWMAELAELTLLDFIFSQQDRVGNIDFLWYWAYSKNGEVYYTREKNLEDSRGDELQRNKVDFSTVQPPEKIAVYNPVLIQKSQLNDNDAGTRKFKPNDNSPYVNYTRKAKMLQKIKHYPANLYSKLIQLNQDFQTEGELFQWMSQSFEINPKYIHSARTFASEALSLLQAKCETGELVFDLNPQEFLLTATTQPKRMDCTTGVYQ